MSTSIGDQTESAVAATPAAPGRLHPGSPLTASRPEPNVIWTVLATLFLGIFGAIAAAIQSSKASTLGYNPARPWIAFGITLVAGVALEVLLVLALLGVLVAGSSSAGVPAFKTDGSLVAFLLVIAVALVGFSFAITDSGLAAKGHRSDG
jgi:hypothetical protein